MKYAHLADLHLGSWKEEKMRQLSTSTFLQAMDDCVSQQVDFILFAGDLFNTSLPALDTLKLVTEKLKELCDKNIPVYVIAGSHDFSPSGRTMIEVLEKAGLVINVCKGAVQPETKELQLQFTIDKKTGAKITGILGRKGQLDQMYYEQLHRVSLEQESGYKIFMFHTTVTELLPRELSIIDASPLSFFPKFFNYYAGGHIHHPAKVELPEQGYACVTYPGALFPNNFSEVEAYGQGGYYLITVENSRQEVLWKPLSVVKHLPLVFDCTNKSPDQIQMEILNYFQHHSPQHALVTLRLYGTMSHGRVLDIKFKEIFTKLYEQQAYFILKNTSKLNITSFEEIKLSETNSEDMEEATIREHLQQTALFSKEREFQIIKQLFITLNTPKREGETQTDFVERIEKDVEQILGLNRGVS